MAAMKWWGWGQEGVEFSHEDKPGLAPFIAHAIGVDVGRKVAAPVRFDRLQIPDHSCRLRSGPCQRRALLGARLNELVDRLSRDRQELAGYGIQLAGWGVRKDTVEVDYFATDRERAGRVFAERYGDMLTPLWLAAVSVAEEPQPFGSWIAEGNTLTVFYALGRNGEQPGRCTANEPEDSVIVTLTTLQPRGAVIAIGGFIRSHATVELSRPVGNRRVIDAVHNLERPQWTGSASAEYHRR